MAAVQPPEVLQTADVTDARSGQREEDESVFIEEINETMRQILETLKGLRALKRESEAVEREDVCIKRPRQGQGSTGEVAVNLQKKSSRLKKWFRRYDF